MGFKTDTVFQKLKAISTESGDYFVDLSDTFPILIKEIDQTGTKGKTNAVFDDFSSIQHELKKLLEQQGQLLSKNRQFLNDLRDDNKKLFSQFEEHMPLLDDVQNIILGIKDGSEEMEVISLNAMVVSIHSGKAGQAFSYITSNLKEMSLRLITQSDQLSRCRGSIQESLTNFRNQIQSTESIDEESENRVSASNEGMLAASERISEKLGSILEQAKAVKGPIIKAMEGIQMQDIIRQSLDDVLIAITKIKEPAETLTPQEQLEQYQANTQLARLSSRCLTKIKEKLDASIKVFKTNQYETNVILNEINNTVDSFITTDVTESNELNEFKTCMEQAIANFDSFTVLFKSYQQVQNHVIDAVTNIQGDVTNMSKVFSGFIPIITMLNYVAIAQRIEVARNEAIRSIKDTVEHMSNLINTTQENVDVAQKKLKDYTESVTLEINQFLERSLHDRANFAIVDEQKKSYSHSITSAYSKLADSISSLSIYTPEFYDCYTHINELIEKLNDLSSRLAESQVDIDALLAYQSAHCEELKNEYGLNDIQLHNQELIDFINHFTITDDKLEAGNIAGISVSHGSAAGEITFF